MTTAEGRTRVSAQSREVDGKFLRVDGRRFPVQGVTYGTFAEGPDGLFPALEQVRRDFAAMAAANVNTVRTYTEPGPRILDLAAEARLRLLVGVWWDDPRHLSPPTASGWRSMARTAHSSIDSAARRCGGHPALLGFLVGNEIPGPVVRWHGHRRVERLLRNLAATARDAAPGCLVGYANYPTTGHLDTSGFDFDAVNVFLEDEQAFSRYVAQLQVESGERPLLLTELGLDAGLHGAQRQAEVIDWQLRHAFARGAAGSCVFSWTDEWWVAGTRVQGWSFGLTTADRRPRTALDVVTERFGRGVGGILPRWPMVTVIVCARNEERTIAECLESLLALDYPCYDVVVVDDGSTDATAAIAGTFPVKVLSIRHGGLSAARNHGLAAASGEIVAYLDADARADPDWLTHIALGLHAPGAAAVGGPNLVPRSDPALTRAIGSAPGGPTCVLLDNERAEHVPGCNVAFRRERLCEIGGFNPVMRTAGDDVDVCWRLLDAGHDVRFAASAVVWHHPRGSLHAFWRQQVGYGIAEALVARAHPGRFDGAGRAYWRGVVYGPVAALGGRSAVYGGTFGQAPFQRLYGGGVQVSATAAIAAIGWLWVGVGLTAAIGASAAASALLALAASCSIALVACCLVAGARQARRYQLEPRCASATLVGLLHLVQPVAREVGQWRGNRNPWDDVPTALPRRPPSPAHGPAPRRLGLGWSGRSLLAVDGITEDDRSAYLLRLRDSLRSSGIHTTVASPWGPEDLVCDGQLRQQLRLGTYAQDGRLYVRLDPGLRAPSSVAELVGVGVVVVTAVVAAATMPPAAAVGALLAVMAAAAGQAWWLKRRVRAVLSGNSPGPPR